MTDREIFILLVGQLVAGGRSHADACEEALNVLAVAEQCVASNQKFAERAAAGVQLGHAPVTQRFQSQEPNLSGTAKPGLAVESPPEPVPATPLTPDTNLVNPVTLDGWGVPVKTDNQNPPVQIAVVVPLAPPSDKPPIAPWANPECKACGGTGYNSKGAACGPCKSKPAPETEKVKAVRGKTGQQIVVSVPKEVPNQMSLDLSGGGSSAPVKLENTVEKKPAPPVATPTGQTFSTDYMTCDQCPSDKLVVNLLPGDQGEAVYTCQTCGHSEGFTLEPDDLVELKARGKRLPPANRPLGPDGEEVFHRSDAAGIERPTKGKRTKKALAVSEAQTKAVNQNQNLSANSPTSSESISPPSLSTNSEPWSEPPESGPSTKPTEKNPEPSPKIKSLVDDLLSPNQNPNLPVNELLAKAELELVVSGWDKAKLIQKWEDLTKKSYSEGMPLGQMADQVVAGMMGVRS